jgi:hypothetical protein
VKIVLLWGRNLSYEKKGRNGYLIKTSSFKLVCFATPKCFWLSSKKRLKMDLIAKSKTSGG